MAKAIGIDLGTTNSVFAVVEGGKPTVITNAEGSRTTPSVVAFTRDGQRLAGQVAKRQAVLNPKNTVHSAKRFIGRRYHEVDAESKIVSYKVLPGKDGAVRFDLNGKQLAPEEISAQVLRKLADNASAYLGEKVKDVVITVPAYFNDAWRQGIEAIHRQVVELLERHGVHPIEALGETFDPHYHEAVSTAFNPDVKHGTIIEEIRKGHVLNGELIRPSRVRVAVNS